MSGTDFVPLHSPHTERRLAPVGSAAATAARPPRAARLLTPNFLGSHAVAPVPGPSRLQSRVGVLPGRGRIRRPLYLAACVANGAEWPSGARPARATMWHLCGGGRA